MTLEVEVWNYQKPSLLLKIWKSSILNLLKFINSQLLISYFMIPWVKYLRISTTHLSGRAPASSISTCSISIVSKKVPLKFGVLKSEFWFAKIRTLLRVYEYANQNSDFSTPNFRGTFLRRWKYCKWRWMKLVLDQKDE